jgi:hypothetical protein
MKFIILGALAAVVSSLKVGREESHNTIFESCSTNDECPSGKKCNTAHPLGWVYCVDCSQAENNFDRCKR